MGSGVQTQTAGWDYVFLISSSVLRTCSWQINVSLHRNRNRQSISMRCHPSCLKGHRDSQSVKIADTENKSVPRLWTRGEGSWLWSTGVKRLQPSSGTERGYFITERLWPGRTCGLLALCEQRVSLTCEPGASACHVRGEPAYHSPRSPVCFLGALLKQGRLLSRLLPKAFWRRGLGRRVRAPSDGTGWSPVLCRSCPPAARRRRTTCSLMALKQSDSPVGRRLACYGSMLTCHATSTWHKRDSS